MEGDVKVASITKVKEDETLEGEEAAVDAEGTDAETATEAAADEQNNLPEEAFSDRENAETYEQLDLSELIYGMPMGEADLC